MVKTLRITTVIAAMLAIAIFSLPVIYGDRTDENIEKFLNSPGVIEKFKESAGNRTQIPTNQVPPLVQQAQDFALILNPPRPDPPRNIGRNNNVARTIVEPPPILSPKFTVEGTSYYKQNPALSLALINEPGKGTYWVRQSSIVNHLLIEQVKDGVVIVKNGEETFELKTAEKKGFPAAPGRTSPLIRSNPPGGNERTQTPAPTRVNTSKTSKTENDAERALKVQELLDNIKLIDAANKDPDNPMPSTEERAAKIQKLITDFKNSNININDEEAQKLTNLGQMLENISSTESGK